MKKMVAILIDGGLLPFTRVKRAAEKELLSDDIIKLSKKCLAEDEEIFRIYYYDCLPFGGKQMHPITLREIDFSTTATFRRRNDFLGTLSGKDHIAFRGGELTCHGWRVKEESMLELIKNPRQMLEKDLQPNMQQKGVDIKIGLDIAWLSSRRIVDRILLITTDSDFIPAMKFARREGTQVVLIKLGRKTKRGLTVHADEVREITI